MTIYYNNDCTVPEILTENCGCGCNNIDDVNINIITTITWNPLEHITTLLSLQCHCVAMGHISSQNVCYSFDKGISKLPKPSDQLAGLLLSTKIAWTIIMDDRNIFSHSYDVTLTRDFIHALLPLSKLVIF